jgi:hypothetical protein
MNPSHRLRLEWLALWAGLLPFFVINISYAVSALSGHIPACFPYLFGCTTISSAGRYGFSYFFFKAGIIPSAVLLAGFWILCHRWLTELGDDNDTMKKSIAVLGVLAALFLTLYTMFLGHRGDFYFLMRRFGVTLYFGFSGLAQIMLLARLDRLRRQGLTRIPEQLLRLMLLMLIGLLIIGLASIPIRFFIVDKKWARNIVEWNFAMLMISYYVVVWRAWLATGFRPTLGSVHR